MNIKTVTVSEKGQIAIPLDVREAIGLQKGDEMILLQVDGRIMLEKSDNASKALKDEFAPLLKASEKIAKELWDNKYDEAWDNV
jgi:AbrB family looped-hinge helix DNA binding protein